MILQVLRATVGKPEHPKLNPNVALIFSHNAGREKSIAVVTTKPVPSFLWH